MAGTIYINPTAKSGGTGTQASPYNSWSNISFTAGTTYLQAAGTTYSGSLYIGVNATAAAPIKIGSYGTGAAPIIKGGVNFDGATYVTFSGFQISNSTGAGVVLQSGANNITISGNTIASSGMGIWIGNGAGTTNTISGNTISNNTQYGIGINEVTGSGTVISNNVISGNGYDGINVDGNSFTISDNTVSGNGLAVFGCSGIHIYASSAADTYGAYNTVTGNVCIGNRDIYEEDGGGILADQWTNHNTISNNFCYANDGAGIGVYDSYDNVVSGNDVGGNELNSGGTHTSAGELMVNQLLGLAYGNTFKNNVALSDSSAPAMFVNSPSSQKNVFSSNVFENLTGGPIYDWNETIGSTLATWDTLANSNDKFSGVPLTPLPTGVTPSFSFPAGFGFSLDGKYITLAGWSPTYGLLGG